MIKVGFVVEDKAFESTINSKDFRRILIGYKLELVGVHNAKGRDNLRNSNDDVSSFFMRLADKGSDFIFAMIDKENDPCIAFAKKNVHIFNKDKQVIVIAVKAIESWFLADSETLSDLFNREYEYDDPENMNEKAFDVLKREFIKYTGKGLGKRRNLHAKYLVNKGFSLENAAKHPKCPSAKYFLKKLSELNPNS
jgi:hypothetical protein